jgi:hypothetical protein
MTLRMMATIIRRCLSVHILELQQTTVLRIEQLGALITKKCLPIYPVCSVFKSAKECGENPGLLSGLTESDMLEAVKLNTIIGRTKVMLNRWQISRKVYICKREMNILTSIDVREKITRNNHIVSRSRHPRTHSINIVMCRPICNSPVKEHFFNHRCIVTHI